MLKALTWSWPNILCGYNSCCCPGKAVREVWSHVYENIWLIFQESVGKEALARRVCSNSSQRCSVRLRTAGQSSPLTSNLLIRVLMDFVMCSGVQSCSNYREPLPKLGVWNEPKYMSAFPAAPRDPVTRTKGATTPHLNIPPPNFTLAVRKLAFC